ncbi:unnamed protein product, partial [Iphiclides podalirius]
MNTAARTTHMDLSKACTALHGIRTAVWFVADAANAAIDCGGRRNLSPTLYTATRSMLIPARLGQTHFQFRLHQQ